MALHDTLRAPVGDRAEHPQLAKIQGLTQLAAEQVFVGGGLLLVVLTA